MAKQNYLKLAVVIVLTMASASTVFAAANTASTLTGTTSIGGSSFAASNKVTCGYAANTANSAGVFDATSYGLACGHLSGDKVVAAVSGDAKLYFAISTNATSGALAIKTDTAVSSTGTWSSM